LCSLLIDFNGSKQGAFLYVYSVTSNLFSYPTAKSGFMYVFRKLVSASTTQPEEGGHDKSCKGSESGKRHARENSLMTP
jgi:hypothetical protein